MDLSYLKKDIFKALSEWDYAKSKATIYNISKVCQCSESQVYKILRDMRNLGLAHSIRGVWHLI